MKKLLILLWGSIILYPLIAGSNTGLPLMYADSYMMRAYGSEANYWNPALLSEETGDIWLPALNSGIFLANNALDLDFYNYIMEKGSISEADKQKLLDMMDGSAILSMSGQSSVLGFTLGNVALTSSVRYYAKAAISERFVELLLYGNEEDRTYEFTREHNHVSSLSYGDITVGMGDIRLPLPQTIPDIRLGWSASLLVGIAELHTARYYGSFSSTIDGFSFHQDATLRKGGGGIGFKGMLGLVSEPIENLHVGVTLDNLLGEIRWGLVRENQHFRVAIDSVYVADLNEDLINYDTWTDKANAFSTKLPMEFRLGMLYKTRQISLSADYVQGFDESTVTSKVGRVSVGAELLPIPILPIHLGYSPGSSTFPWRVSYGVGLRILPFEFGLGLQTFESVLPSYSTKGLALASYFRFRM